MKKKPFLTRMRMFIAAGSFVGLIGGWAMLAQAGDPISTATASTALTEQAPTQLTSFGTATSTTTTTTARTTTRVMLRTGGS